MAGTYHMIPLAGRYTKRSRPDYVTRSGRVKYYSEEFTTALCGREVIRDRDQFCNVGIANPNWNYDWCDRCVKAVVWTEEAKELWRRHGIAFDDVEGEELESDP